MRRSLAGRGLPLVRPDLPRPDRYLLYAALTSARRQVVLVRRAVDDAGRPREASPFWNDVREALGDGCPPVERHGLRDLTYELDDAPSERERLRALAALAGGDAARRAPDRRTPCRAGRVASTARPRRVSRGTRHRRPGASSPSRGAAQLRRVRARDVRRLLAALVRRPRC